MPIPGHGTQQKRCLHSRRAPPISSDAHKDSQTALPVIAKLAGNRPASPKQRTLVCPKLPAYCSIVSQPGP